MLVSTATGSRIHNANTLAATQKVPGIWGEAGGLEEEQIFNREDSRLPIHAVHSNCEFMKKSSAVLGITAAKKTTCNVLDGWEIIHAVIYEVQ